MSEEQIREKIQQAMTEGKICYRTEEGIYSMPMVEFVQQPLEGMLYDINRDRATVMAFIDDPKWTNDLALTQLLEYYYNENIRLKKEIEQFKKVEGSAEGWYEHKDTEYMCGFKFDEPIELPVDVYVREKIERGEIK